MPPWTLRERREKRRRVAVVPIGGYGQDIETISLVPHGRFGGGIQVGIGSKAGLDRDGLGTPSIGLHRSTESGRLADATGRSHRQQYRRQETQSAQPCGCFRIHSVGSMCPAAHEPREARPTTRQWRSAGSEQCPRMSLMVKSIPPRQEGRQPERNETAHVAIVPDVRGTWDYRDFLKMRYFLYGLTPASSSSVLTASLSSRVQPISRERYFPFCLTTS